MRYVFSGWRLIMRCVILALALLALIASVYDQTEKSFPVPSEYRTMRVDRLERLAADLEGRVQRLYEARPRCFVMDLWANGDDPSSEKFAGCAAAHGTYLLANEGFRVEQLIPVIGKEAKYTVVYGDLYEIHATMEFFGIDYTTACRLFGYSRDSRPSPREVAACIRAIIKSERVRLATDRVGGGVVGE
jgi:hypothetical protein